MANATNNTTATAQTAFVAPAPAPAGARAKAQVLNGVRVPTSWQGKCGAVWAMVLAYPAATTAQLKSVMVAQGYNASNVSQEAPRARAAFGLPAPAGLAQGTPMGTVASAIAAAATNAKKLQGASKK